MLTVEDCLANLWEIATKHPTCGGRVLTVGNVWDSRFINDLAEHVGSGNAVSTAQGDVIVKLISRYREELILQGIDEVALDLLIKTPLFRQTPYQSTNLPREVRWVGDNKLVFRCKFNASIIEDIKRLKGTNYFLPIAFPTFKRDHKLWIVDVNSGNWEKAMDIIKRHRFAFDDQVAQYFHDVSESVNQSSEMTLEDQRIRVVVRDDDLLNAWLNGITALENH